MMNRSGSKKDKTIILVEGSGFCFGVKNAIQKAKRARAELDKEIFTLGISYIIRLWSRILTSGESQP